MSLPPVSVIIPTYNRARFITQAVDSVLGQTYPEVELIVIDDGSTDETPTLLSAYGKQLRYIFQDNRGPAAARNTGLRAAAHDLVAFLDSDDRWTPEKLAVQAAAMRNNPEYLISHTEEVWFRRGVHLNQRKRHRKTGGDIFHRCLELCAVGMSTAMVRARLFNEIGLFDEDLPCCEDYDLWLRASAQYPFLYIDRPLTIKEGGRQDQVSAMFRVGMDRFRIRAIEKILSAPGLSARQRQLAQETLVTKCTIYGKGCIKHNKVEEGCHYLALADRILNP